MIVLAGSVARASTTEPDGTVVPTTASVGSETQLSTLFSDRSEALDSKLDALIVPVVFSPTCGFTGTLVLSQAGCHSALGWYNVDPNRTTPPDPADIFELVPRNAALNTQFSGGDIQNDARYAGGLIGLAKGTRWKLDEDALPGRFGRRPDAGRFARNRCGAHVVLHEERYIWKYISKHDRQRH